MKKLMIAAAIVCAAAFAQAATVQWTAADIATVATQGSEAPEALSGAYYMCFLSSDPAGQFDAGKMLTAAQAEAYVKAKNWEALEAAAITTKTTTPAGGISSATVGNYAKGDTAPTGFAIIFDAATTAEAENYMITASATSSAFSQATTKAKIALGSQASNTWNAISNVPEPTSALLMLVGLAGLALRRKQK